MAVLALNDDSLLPQAKSNAKVVYNLSPRGVGLKSYGYLRVQEYCLLPIF